jgi:hypothetical protein
MIPVIWHINEHINDELYLSLLIQEKKYLLNKLSETKPLYSIFTFLYRKTILRQS